MLKEGTVSVVPWAVSKIAAVRVPGVTMAENGIHQISAAIIMDM